MRSPSVKPSAYPPIPFHTIRFLIFLSSIVTGVILAVFTYHLHTDGYKLPYSFIVLLVSSALSLLNILLTTIIHCTRSLSTKLSLTTNLLLTILWSVSLALMTWSLAHTITTSCNNVFWGNATGIAVCRAYKALFAFNALGVAAYLAAVWLDIVVRRRQTRLGAYDAMGSQPGLDDAGAFDVKMDDRHSELTPALHDYDVPAHGHAGYHSAPGPYERGWEGVHGGEAQGYYDAAPGMNRRGVPRTGETGYDPAMYR
ncbi:uncharacterized protein N7515_005601 [Penicillium bovifimosum]|uniref:MARVEL domain-containing protein n=1 Tax=Penicillium bovifimosum TaxID=126998 RepID=A0A9W9GTA0_9EURO|nr:uncharacterized protein N7515_005601 [Penicillium bovifimosum]KAJ5129562.1 hypothetical protein N7515_005601 [Penicillium bovifimosum]